MNDINFSILFSQFSALIVYFKVAFLIVALFLLIAIFLLLFKNSWLKYRFLENLTEFFIYRPFGVKKTFKRWAKIIKRLEEKSETECKLAVIEADNLLDEVLKKIGYEGKTMEERLEQVDQKTLPVIDEIREAHRVRNSVVRDPDYHLTPEEAKRVVGIYEQALRDLEMF